jgi:GLPGLI family protein
MRFLSLTLAIILPACLAAQTLFIQQGRIRYERRIGQMTLMEALLDSSDASMMDLYRKEFPRVLSSRFTLDFDARGSIYRVAPDREEQKYLFREMAPRASDFVRQSFEAGETLMRRTVAGEERLLRDSLPTYVWKIVPETRTIAGFECRKALTRICDSVVVVAFYTDEITVRGGPEQFHGLPGMILGIAVPRLSMTIFATQFERLDDAKPAYPDPPRKKPLPRDPWMKMMGDVVKADPLSGRYLAWLGAL